jgi:outer membrane protein
MNMKKLLIALCVLLTSAYGAHAQTKLGHIDRQGLMLALPERKDAEAKMQAFAKQLDDKLKAMGEEYKAKLAEVQSHFDSMTQTEKEAAQRELADMEQRITTAQENAKEDLSKQEQELLAPMVERTDKAIKDVANANNFTYIFDSSTGMVLFYEKGEDIMPLVKKALGITTP